VYLIDIRENLGISRGDKIEKDKFSFILFIIVINQQLIYSLK